MSSGFEQPAYGTLIGDGLPGAPALSGRGEHPIGVRTLTLVQKDRPDVTKELRNGRYPRADRKLTLEAWYPAAETAPGTPRAVYTDHMGRIDLGNLRPFRFPGRAVRDAEPDFSGAPWPVIVISHGYPGSRMLLSNLAENLSTKGYVVLSIGHTDNTYEDFLKKGSMESALIHRSMDQRFVLSSLEALNGDGWMKGLIQPEGAGLIGFSMGGYGLLRTLGARMSEPALQEYAAFREELAEAADYHGTPAVRCAALFAPAVFWFDPVRTEDITAPTLWFCGTADRTVVYEKVRAYCRRADRSERYLISYENCGHNVANNPAPECALGEEWGILKRWADPVWDTRRLNCCNCHFATAFFDLYLKGRTDRLALLTPQGEGVWPGFEEGGHAGIRAEHYPRVRA